MLALAEPGGEESYRRGSSSAGTDARNGIT